MRLNWTLQQGSYLCPGDIQQACAEFYKRHQVVPDTIKLAYQDYLNFLGMSPVQPKMLEKGKEYGLFLTIPGGMVELTLMEEDGEAVGNVANGISIFAVESSKVDREFEKHILNKGEE